MAAGGELQWLLLLQSPLREFCRGVVPEPLPQNLLPLEFMTAVVNNFGGFYNAELYLHEARMCGANVHAPCINQSQYLTHIYGKDIYVGFIHIAQLEQKTAHHIIEERCARAISAASKTLSTE